MVQKIWSLFLDVVFPPVCVNCLRRGEKALCEECSDRIEIHNSFFCPECNRRLPEAKNFCHPQAKFILAAAASYEDRAVRELIHSLKYNRAKAALQPLSEITGRYLEKVLKNFKFLPAGRQGKFENFAIVPLPLHPRKEKERGFNQAALIAQVFALVLHDREAPALKIETGNFKRVKNTKSQTGMKDTEERERNISGAFLLEKPEEVAGKNIVLVDDVFTSGATMKEAVRVLKAAGVKKIIGFVIAKA